MEGKPHTTLQGAAQLSILSADPAPSVKGALGRSARRRGGATVQGNDSHRRRLELLSIVAKVFLCAFNVAGLAAAIVGAESVYFARKQDPAGNPLGRCDAAFRAKLAATVLTACSIGCYAVLAWLRWSIMKIRDTVPGQRFFESPVLARFAYDACLVALHCPVGCYANLEVFNYAGIISTYDADSLISVVMFLRLMPLFNLAVQTLAHFNRAGANLVSAQSGVRLNTLLALRFTMKRWTVLTTTVM